MLIIKSGKNGAEVNGIRTEALLALIIANDVLTSFGYDCVLTEATGGKHSSGSLHYIGNAIDLRTRHIPPIKQDEIKIKLKEALGDQYDVVLERDHFHIEFQPKT